MSIHNLKTLLLVGAIAAVLSPAVVAAQNAAQSKAAAPAAKSGPSAPVYYGAFRPAKNSFGHPDVSGAWSNASLTGLARQATYGGRLKHLEMTAWDREIEQRVAADLKLGKTHRIHPSTMYRLFNAYWRQLAPVTLIDAFTAFGPLPKPDRPDVRAALPRRYVAAKFYANGALPDTADNRRFINEALRSLTATSDVVLLDTGVRFDDHGDLPSDVRSRVHRLTDLMRPEDNLEVQSAAIAGADAFVGTYGGFSYLAPLLGVNTVAFYSHPTGFRFDHLDVARRVFSALQVGAFVPLDLRELPVTRLALGIGDVVAALTPRGQA